MPDHSPEAAVLYAFGTATCIFGIHHPEELQQFRAVNFDEEMRHPKSQTRNA
jgi:hypothetical protein